MDVEAIMRGVDEDLATAQSQLRAAIGRVEEAHARAAESQERVDELVKLREGFLMAVQRYGHEAAPAEIASAPAADEGNASAPNPLLALSQKDAVLKILAEIGRPASTAEIYDRFVKAGRPEDSEKVRSALGYLARRARKISRMDRGQWELLSQPNGQAAQEPALSRNGSEHVGIVEGA